MNNSISKETSYTGSEQFTPAQQAILITILYSDIFSFPLTKDELWKFLISEKKIRRRDFDSGLQSLKNIAYHGGYYCLKSREEIISQRKKNFPEVTKKMHQARNVAQKLSAIPSVLFIGVSGGLAVGNADANDDIDLVIIAKKNTLFTTRFLILGMLEILGVRRYRNQKETANTICLNLLFDETALIWFADKKDIYTAREIAQIVPLFERDDVYQRFFIANTWIQNWLPNQIPSSLRKQGSKNHMFRDSHFPPKGTSFTEAARGNDNRWARFISKIFIHPVSEYFFRSLQISWMKRHKTKETITNHLLAFHPYDYKILTLKQLRLKMRQLGLLTKF